MEFFNGFCVGDSIKTLHRGRVVNATVERLDSMVFDVSINGVVLTAMWMKDEQGRHMATTQVG